MNEWNDSCLSGTVAVKEKRAQCCKDDVPVKAPVLGIDGYSTCAPIIGNDDSVLGRAGALEVTVDRWTVHKLLSVLYN